MTILDFRNDNKSLTVDYNDLIISKKFTPITKFELKERIENSTLYVSEFFYKNDRITFGFVDLLIYKRV